MGNLNIYHMHLVELLLRKMSVFEFARFIDEFNQMLADDKPEMAQDLINSKLSDYGIK